MKLRRARVFIGLHEIAGFYNNLHEGFTAAGCRTRLVTVTHHPFGYEEPARDWLGNTIRWWLRKALNIEGEKWPGWMPRWLRQVTGQAVVLLAALTHDVFIFSCGITFADALGTKSIPWLKLFRRKVAIIFHGSDSRAAWCDRCGYIKNGHQVTGLELLDLIEVRKRKVQRAHDLADVVMDWPLSGHFHPKRFLNRLLVGTPIRIAPLPTGHESERFSPKPVRILHCPSDSGIKGTAEIRRVIRQLQKEGWDLDFIELSGVDNARVLEEIRRCDFVIDQLFSDIPMSGFAREAAMLGKAAVVGGYGWDELKAGLAPDDWPPTILCHPDELELCLKKLLEPGRSPWREIGMKAQDYVRSRWTPAACAERLLHALLSPEESTLWVDPKACHYLWGCGVHALESLEMTQTIMRIAGPAGFQLEDKPELLAKCVELGSIGLAQHESRIPEFTRMEEPLWHVARTLVERNAELQRQIAETSKAPVDQLDQREDETSALLVKLENFRNMIRRRDDRIAKLSAKLEKLGKKTGRTRS